MPLTTTLTEALSLRVPVVQGGMQWVGVPQLVAAVCNAGGLGILTALTQPSPDALRSAIRETKSLLRPEVLNRCQRYNLPFAVNITLLPSINPPDYAGFARAAIEEGVRIFETAGNNPGPLIKELKKEGAYVLHKCTTIKHAISSQKMGVDCLSIDGWECAGHPGNQPLGGLVLLARASESLHLPYIASGGIANGQGLAAALSLGACGVNMGTRFLATKEAVIHENVKNCMVGATELDTVHILTSFKNTARVYKNKVAEEVVRLESQGAAFPEVQPLVSGQRGRRVYTEGDVEAGVWSASPVLGLIHDVPTCQELLDTMERDAEERIERMAGLVARKNGAGQKREARL
ncbi:putative 2-Nitropropane dioxygenase [Jaminaea rosea]|uniref:Putative 2-Nitropropane dioxygenase n=1 Tax=Jaminaea rosea TaxID=1569628 RepID=A0A316UKI2_9BASI|nr:putative 2-Nitropropane dioxygenase [Jaminaea rosea]PWN25776.1 putative 2-Nitropropane dioxygenase [Jaminaea rosea]